MSQDTQLEESSSQFQVNAETGEIIGYSYNPNAVRIKKKLNLPLLKQKPNGSIDVFFLSRMFQGKEGISKKGEDKKKDPATIANVLNLISGTPAQIILSTVQIKILAEMYPNDSYIDKSFRLYNFGKLDGRDYNSVSIDEIEVPLDPSMIQAVKSLVINPD